MSFSLSTFLKSWPFVFCCTLLIVVIAYFYHTHTHTDEVTYLISMTDSGFTPNTLTLEVGTKIVFTNTGANEHWPASDDHPSHTLYDGTLLSEHCTQSTLPFDACGAVAPGESWEFIFTKAGTYSYHDHLWPQFGGTITILPTKNSPATIDTRSTDTKYTYLKAHYSNLVEEQNPQIAISALRDASEKDPEVSSRCHDVLHDIGRVAYQKYGGFDNAVRFQSDFCNSGYIHGLFESYFTESERPFINLSGHCTANTLHKRPFDLWQCYHGIGHGVMYYTGGELDTALQICSDQLPADEANICQNGVLMEVFNAEIVGKEEQFVDPNDPLATCRVREMNKTDCYLYAPTYFYQVRNIDFYDIFAECVHAEDGYQSVCIGGTGAEVMKRNMQSIDTVTEICGQTETDADRFTCVEGAVRMYVNQTGSVTEATELCSSIALPYKDLCQETVDALAPLFMQ